MTLPLRRNSHILSLAVLTVVVAAIGVVSTLAWDEYGQQSSIARHARSVAERAQRLMSSLERAEAIQLGYIISGDSGRLSGLNDTVALVRRSLAELNDHETGDAAAFARVDEPVREKLQEIQRTIELRQAGSRVEAETDLASHQSFERMGAIRAGLDDVIEEQYRLFSARSLLARRNAAKTRLIVILGTLTLGLLLLGANIHIHRLIRAQDRLIDDLAAARDREEQAKGIFETTLESIADAVISVDSAGRVQFINTAAERLTGWPRALATHSPLSDVFRIIDDQSGSALNDPVSLAIAQGSVSSLSDTPLLVTRQDRRLPINDSAAPLRNRQGEIVGAVLVFRDVSPRREAQRQLEESEKRYRLLFDSNPQPMWVLEVGSLKFLEVNHAAVKHYGYSREEFMSLTLADIRIPEEGSRPVDVPDASTGDLLADGTSRHRRKDGSEIYVDITGHPLAFQGRDARLALIQDITTRAQLEEQLRQSQKLEAVGHLAGGVAHDFNNMLTVISGYTEMLSDMLVADRAASGAVEQIAGAARRAASLTQQLLAFSRRQVLQPQVLNLNDSLIHIRKMLSRLLGEDIEVTTILAADLWNVSADPGQVDQVLMNLAVNARDAMESGGALTIQTSNAVLDDEYVASHVGVGPGEYVRLSVSDTGHGMDSATRARLFEPFFTTKEVGRGTGLGLSTIYGIVKQSHGNIWVYSEPGKGTTFAVYLPRCKSAASSSRAVETARPPKATGQSILVVEDDSDVLKLVSAMLTSSGYAVLTARLLSEALQVCAESEPVDLLLCDMVLKQDDGPAVAQEFLKVHPGVPVIFMSGYTEHPVLRQEGFGETTPFLQKPFSRDALTHKIRSLLGPARQA